MIICWDFTVLKTGILLAGYTNTLYLTASNVQQSKKVLTQLSVDWRKYEVTSGIPTHWYDTASYSVPKWTSFTSKVIITWYKSSSVYLLGSIYATCIYCQATDSVVVVEVHVLKSDSEDRYKVLCVHYSSQVGHIIELLICQCGQGSMLGILCCILCDRMIDVLVLLRHGLLLMLLLLRLSLLIFAPTLRVRG